MISLIAVSRVLGILPRVRDYLLTALATAALLLNGCDAERPRVVVQSAGVPALTSLTPPLNEAEIPEDDIELVGGGMTILDRVPGCIVQGSAMASARAFMVGVDGVEHELDSVVTDEGLEVRSGPVPQGAKPGVYDLIVARENRAPAVFPRAIDYRSRDTQ